MNARSAASPTCLLAKRIAGLCLLLPTFCYAQVIWDGGAGNNRWGSGNNWSTNNVPNGGSKVQFDAIPSPPATIELRGDRSAYSLNYNNVTADFALVNGTGSRTLTLTSGIIFRTGSGVQSLDFTTLALDGNAAINIDGTGTFTISSDIIDSGGARSLTKTGSGELILSGTNTYTGNTTLSAGKLTLESDTALLASSTLTLAGGILKLNTANTTINTLNITGNSTIDFGGLDLDAIDDVTLNVTNFSISAGVTLSIINWVNAADYFYVANWLNGGSGAGVYDTTGANPMNQVSFNGFAASDTKWLSYGPHQVTPVPEPATYGALLLGLATGLVFWRRRLAGLIGHESQPQIVKIKAEVGQG